MLWIWFGLGYLACGVVRLVLLFVCLCSVAFLVVFNSVVFVWFVVFVLLFVVVGLRWLLIVV